MEEKSFHRLALERLQSALDNFDASFIVSNKLFRLALVSEILDTTCLFEQLHDAWQEHLPFGEGPDADVDFEYWKTLSQWNNLIDNAQQNICINNATYSLGNGFTSDEITGNKRKQFNKNFLLALKHANFEDSKVISDFFRWVNTDKSSSLTYGNILFGALQALLSILNKINNLLTNPSQNLLKDYCVKQKERFKTDVEDAYQHIQQICSTKYTSKRKQNQLRDYEDKLKESLVASGFLVNLGGEYTKYDIQDYRNLCQNKAITDVEILNDLIIKDLITEYHSGNFYRLNIHLFQNRKILRKEAICSFFVFVELYPELQSRIGELGLIDEKSKELNEISFTDLITQHTEAMKEQTAAMKEILARPTEYNAVKHVENEIGKVETGGKGVEKHYHKE